MSKNNQQSNGDLIIQYILKKYFTKGNIKYRIFSIKLTKIFLYYFVKMILKSSTFGKK